MLRFSSFRHAKGFLSNVRTFSRLSESQLAEPNAPIPGKHPLWVSSAAEMFSQLASGAKIYLQGGACTPTILAKELCSYALAQDISNVEIHYFHPDGPMPFLDAKYNRQFRVNCSFASPSSREALNDGRADFLPIFISEVPLLFRRNYVNLDYALITVTPPDKHGFCSLGTGVDVTRAAIQNAKLIVGQVNPSAPVTRGDATIHMSQIDFLMHGPMPLHELDMPEPSEIESSVAAKIVDSLLEDGATLHIGAGKIPRAVTSHISQHKGLGIHTEMFSDGVVDLVNLGIITNGHKRIRSGKILASFVLGTKKVFDFVDENPLVDLCDISYSNSMEVIASNPKVTSVNSCLEMDLTGQVCSDSLGTRLYSGVGGFVDFLRGASNCFDGRGKPIVALSSTTSAGESKIVPFLKEGAGVVCTRAHVHYVVTEYGIAYLFGKNLRQRAHALINVAHPDHRERLEKAAFDRLQTMPSPD